MDLPSPPFHIDFRIATSAVEGLRFELATRVADLGELAGRLESMVVRSSARRAQLRSRLRHADVERERLLAALPASPTPGNLHEVLDTGIALHGELGTLDERIAAGEARVEGIREEAATLRSLSEALLAATELRGATLDEEMARRGRATRGLEQLVHEDTAALIRSVLDGPVQQLADVAVHLDIVRQLLSRRMPGARGELSHCRESVRRVSLAFEHLCFDIRPDVLDAAGAAAALRALARQVSPPAACRFDLIGADRRLCPELEVTLFRLVQEAVANALEHGQAGHIDAVLSVHGDRVVVVVRDDGEGFDVVATEARLSRTGALGILTMRERVELLGGVMKLRSAAGAGTEVRATFPIRGGLLSRASPGRGGSDGRAVNLISGEGR